MFTSHGTLKILVLLFSSFKAVLSTGGKVDKNFYLWSFEISLQCSMLSLFFSFTKVLILVYIIVCCHGNI